MKRKVFLAMTAMTAMVLLPAMVVASTVDFQDDFGWGAGVFLGTSSNWTESSSAFLVTNGEARARATAGVALCDAGSVGATDTFSVSVDLNKAGTSGYWAGLVIGAQSSTDYIVARVRTDGAYQVSGGGVSKSGLGPAALALTPSFTNLEVTRDDAGLYTFLFDGTALTTWNSTDVTEEYNSGQVGILNGGTGSHYFFRFDNFDLSVVPEPATMGLIGCGFVGMLLRRKR